MRDIWVISDTHFLHRAILSFKDKNGNLIRPDFDGIYHMNEVIINNWNSVVKDNDIIYHLGDVFMGSRKEFKNIWERLKGRKRLVVGNHDDIKYLSKENFFQKITMWRMFPEFGLILSHLPLHATSLKKGDKILLNLHGHIHQNKSPEGSYHNCCVEVNNYKPINIEDVRIC
ncbi:hypothetical protein GW796_08995 [archaeon]|nr:hypothetical protein [archaeon]NCT58868.1 hypothetical protein [archaeon]